MLYRLRNPKAAARKPPAGAWKAGGKDAHEMRLVPVSGMRRGRRTTEGGNVGELEAEMAGSTQPAERKCWHANGSLTFLGDIWCFFVFRNS